MLLYLISINLIAGIVFIVDKVCGKLSLIRVPESILHLLEIFGGVFSIFLLIPILNHKTSKPRYWVLTLVIFVGWISYLLFFN